MSATANNATYTISLPQFEGPFDLLLFFIERDELDIYDIPISKITEEFLEYTRQIEALDIDLASEFILVAATLMRIKAKMLIPRKELDEAGNEIDPREELVQRLLEYKRYKSVLDEMRAMEEARAIQEKRGNTTKELQQIATKALVDIELESVTLFKLLKTFERMLHNFEDREKSVVVHKVYQYSYTIQDQQRFLIDTVKKEGKTSFQTVFGACKDRIHAIVTFLALLELLNVQTLHIMQGLEMNNFWLTIPSEIDESPETEYTIDESDDETTSD